MGLLKKIKAQRRKRMNEGEADDEERRDGEHGDKTEVQRGSECRELRGSMCGDVRSLPCPIHSQRQLILCAVQY